MKSSTSSNPPVAAAAADHALASSIRESLAPLSPLLEAFNHRHKNQHRSSHWWPRFNVFRRSVRAICVSGNHVASDTLSRSRWLRDTIIPNAYVPFTQLVADNQHAALGLMLVALLARIAALLTEILPAETPAPALSTSVAVSSFATDAALHYGETVQTDKGVTIERSNGAATSDSIPLNTTEGREMMSKRKTTGTDSTPHEGKIKKRKKTKAVKRVTISQTSLVHFLDMQYKYYGRGVETSTRLIDQSHYGT